MIVLLNRVFRPPTLMIHPMKARFIFIVTGMLFFPAVLFSQSAVTLQRGEQAQFFSSFTEALAAAQQGDVMYLPGGTFNIGNVIINKKISIVGAGHYPSHTAATGITYLSGSVYLVSGADSTMLQGFYLTGDIRLGSTGENQEVHFINISRCSFNDLYLSYNGYSETSATMISISENVIRGGISGGYAQHVLINKNLVGITIAHFNQNANFSNNIFLYNGPSYAPLITNVMATTFYNNNFLAANYLVGTNSYGLGFYNNLFVNSFAIPGGSFGAENITGISQADIFINQTGNSFSYDHDYHLKPTSAGVEGGSDGFDIGLYGSSVPYKEGAVPFNPHITDQAISPGTNPQGQIEVNIQVEAQPR